VAASDIGAMRMRTPAVALLLIATTTLACGQADAAGKPDPKAGSGSVGTVNVMLGGTPTLQSSIAPCTAPGKNSTAGVTPVTGVEYGSAKTTCTVDKKTGEATALVSGKRFRMSLLHDHGGPVIKLISYSVQCSTDHTGSKGSMSVSGLTGITLPSNIPANYKVTIPGKHPNDPVLAKVVINELVTPSPPDGSMVMNMLHIKLFPNTPNSPDSGDIVLGTVSCDPT
jgi:hypothetical protein